MLKDFELLVDSLGECDDDQYSLHYIVESDRIANNILMRSNQLSSEDRLNNLLMAIAFVNGFVNAD